jgi:hypothetical protein
VPTLELLLLSRQPNEPVYWAVFCPISGCFSTNTTVMALSSTPWQALWNRLPAPLQNRYYLTLVVFLFIMVFLDRHSIWTQWKLWRAQNQLETDRTFYQGKIKDAREEAEDFELTKEKFAREHYYMKRSNEDVFIIQEKK